MVAFLGVLSRLVGMRMDGWVCGLPFCVQLSYGKIDAGPQAYREGIEEGQQPCAQQVDHGLEEQDCCEHMPVSTVLGSEFHQALVTQMCHSVLEQKGSGPGWQVTVKPVGLS